MAEKYYTFKPKLEDCEKALALLLRRNLIRPIVDFRGKTRYVLSDPALIEFLNEFYSFSELENEFLNVKWQYEGGPTFNERQSRRVFYSDETKSDKFFNVRELQRHQFRQALKEKKNKGEQILKLQTELSGHLREFEKGRDLYVNYTVKKNLEIFKKYPFLRDLIYIVSPILSEAISSR